LRDATIAVGYESRNRCPDLIQADVQEPSAALIVLVVGPSGVPSQPSLKSSSGSETLDAAALSCVMKLRFLPAVRAGEGSAMASWQEIAWTWGRGYGAQSPAAAAAAVAAAAPTIATAAGPAPPGSARPPAASGGAEVRVCADESGRLAGDPIITRSSGDSALDEAALRIARSGAPYYRPSGAAAVTGCAQLAIKFETK
jgi:TonB family protein